jgi:hypothetical protein
MVTGMYLQLGSLGGHLARGHGFQQGEAMLLAGNLATGQLSNWAGFITTWVIIFPAGGLLSSHLSPNMPHANVLYIGETRLGEWRG